MNPNSELKPQVEEVEGVSKSCVHFYVSGTCIYCKKSEGVSMPTREAAAKQRVLAHGGVMTPMKRFDGTAWFQVLKYWTDWTTVMGTGETEDDAWNDAAAKLPAPPSPEGQRADTLDFQVERLKFERWYAANRMQLYMHLNTRLRCAIEDTSRECWMEGIRQAAPKVVDSKEEQEVEELHDPETGTTRYLPPRSRKSICKNCNKALTRQRGEWLHVGANGYLHWNCEDDSGRVADPKVEEQDGEQELPPRPETMDVPRR